MNIYEKAVKEGLTFNYLGVKTLQELQSLGIQELKKYATTLHKGLKELKEETLFERMSNEEETTQLQFDITMDLIKYKQEGLDYIKLQASKSQEKQELLAILHTKQKEQLHELSEEELKAKIAAL